jgi:hypothetical protein
MVRSRPSTAVTSPNVRVRPRAVIAGAASSEAGASLGDMALLVRDVVVWVMVCMVVNLRITAARS